MFSEIDKNLFPDCCEVIQLASQQFVYPIMKNGSSSFYLQITQGNAQNWKVIRNNDISSIASPLITFIRDPKQRFISGVNTYVHHLKRDEPTLDDKTIMWFVDKYLFLNRHYCPQFFWLVNLARYCNPGAVLSLRPMSDVDSFAGINFAAEVPPPTNGFMERISQFNWKPLELYFYLDQILYDLIGQDLTYQDILNKVKEHHTLYELVFAQTQNICHLVWNALDSIILLDSIPMEH